MNVVLYAAALVLVASMLGGLVRVGRGPAVEDRLSAALLLGSTGVALLLMLSAAVEAPTLRDVALVLVVLSCLVVVVFVGPDVTSGRATRASRRGRS